MPAPLPDPALSRNVAVMASTMILTITGILCWYRVLPNHLRTLGADDVQINLVLLVMFLPNRIAQVFGGRLADRIGRKRIIIVVTVLMGASFVAIGLSPTWTSAMVALSACWFLGGFQWPALLALVTESVPEHKRGRALALIEGATVLGATLGPTLGARIEAALVDTTLSWTMLLCICAGLYLVSVTIRLILLRETHAPIHRTRPTVPPIRPSTLFWPCLMGTFSGLTLFLTAEGPLISLYLEDELGMSRALIDHRFVAIGIVSILGVWFAGWMADRFGPEKVMVAALGLMAAVLCPFVGKAAGIWALPKGSDGWLFVALFLPLEFQIIGCQRFVTSQTSPDQRGSYVGYYSMITGLTSGWVFLLSGPLYRKNHSLPFALAAATALLGAGAACILVLRRARPSTEKVPSNLSAPTPTMP